MLFHTTINWRYGVMGFKTKGYRCHGYVQLNMLSPTAEVNFGYKLVNAISSTKFVIDIIMRNYLKWL